MNDSKQSKEDWIFYHALYHLVAHWAAFVGTLGLLTTVGVVISSTAMPLTGIRRLYCQSAILGLSASSLFIVWRMITYGRIVKQMISTPEYEKQLRRVGALNYAVFIVISIAAISFLAVAASIVLWRTA